MAEDLEDGEIEEGEVALSGDSAQVRVICRCVAVSGNSSLARPYFGHRRVPIRCSGVQESGEAVDEDACEEVKSVDQRSFRSPDLNLPPPPHNGGHFGSRAPGLQFSGRHPGPPPRRPRAPPPHGAQHPAQRFFPPPPPPPLPSLPSRSPSGAGTDWGLPASRLPASTGRAAAAPVPRERPKEDDKSKEEREKEELFASLRELTRYTTVQDAMR